MLGETSDLTPKKAKKKGETSAAPVQQLLTVGNAALPLPVISAQGVSTAVASGSKVAPSVHGQGARSSILVLFLRYLFYPYQITKFVLYCFVHSLLQLSRLR